MPASALNRVVLPVLGLPTRAIRGMRTATMSGAQERSGDRGDADTGGFVATEAQSIIGQTHLHRVAERGKPEHFNLSAFQKSHFHQALHQRVLAEDFIDSAVLADLHLIE